MALTIISPPTETLRNSRVPLDGAPHCETQWRLSLDEGGTVQIYSRDYYGSDGTPMDIWHRRTLEWGFRRRGDQSVTDAAELAADLAEGGVLRALLERVHAGHSVDWNGSNMVGGLTDDATEASDEIERLLDKYATDDTAPTVWDAYEWLTARGSTKAETVLRDLGITADATEEEISVAAKDADSIAKGDDVELVDTEKAVRELIREVKEAAAE